MNDEVQLAFILSTYPFHQSNHSNNKQSQVLYDDHNEPP